LTVDSRYPYDVTPDQAKGTTIYLVCFLSALAPRMSYLEGVLAPKQKVTLAAQPAAALERFRKATKRQIEVQFSSRREDDNDPTRLLCRFVPVEQGGTDQRQLILKSYAALIPRERIPEKIEAWPEDLKNHATENFTQLYLHFYFKPHEQIIRGRFDE